MRRLLLSFLVLMGTTRLEAAGPALTVQEATLQKVLRADQDRAGFHDSVINLSVKLDKDMVLKNGDPCLCWGQTYAKDGYYQIDILAAQSYPKNFPAKDIAYHQRQVVQHEVLHIVFHELGMPDQYQDQYITALLPIIGVK